MGDDGILRVQYPQNCHLTLALMEKFHQKRLDVCSEPCALLVHAETVASAEYEAQQFASHEEVAPLVLAMGIIVKSVFTRAMSELFMRFHKPPYPTRVFTEERAALEWLAQFLPDEMPGPDRGDSKA